VNYTNLSKQKFKLVDEFKGHNINAIFETTQGALFCSYGRGKAAYYPSIEKQKRTSPTLLPAIKNKQTILFFFEYGEHDLWAVSVYQLLKWYI